MQATCQCGAVYEVDDADAGKQFQCPKCQGRFAAGNAPASVPAPEAAGSKAAPQPMVGCRDCGTMISRKALACPRCGRHRLCDMWVFLTNLAFLGFLIGFLALFLVLIKQM